MSQDLSCPWAKRWPNLAQPRLGAAILSATDAFFAPAERLLDPNPPVFVPDKFDDHGKWMDGWETRRRRDGGHDHCVIALGRPGRIRGIELDTRHFTGNYPPAAAIEACRVENAPDADTAWHEILPATDLRGDEQRFLEIDDPATYSHLRLHIYPDGGIARLRVYGEIRADTKRLRGGAAVDLAALVNGGRVVGYNDAHYGSPWNLLSPGRGVNMGDGWETRRRREPGHDWAILALACPGVVERIAVDTAHFKGNYPDRCSLQAARVEDGTEHALVSQALFWPELLPAQRLSADAEHVFTDLAHGAPVTHVKLNMLPDGGISRLRVYGRPV